MKVGYYGISAVGVLVFGLFFLGNLFQAVNTGDTWQTKAVLLVAGLTGLGFMAWAYTAGHMGGHWLMGIGLILLGVVLFGIMMLGGMLMFGNGSWQ